MEGREREEMGGLDGEASAELRGGRAGWDCPLGSPRPALVACSVLWVWASGQRPLYLPQLLARTARAGVVVMAALQMDSGGDSKATKILSHQVLFP